MIAFLTETSSFKERMTSFFWHLPLVQVVTHFKKQRNILQAQKTFNNYESELLRKDDEILNYEKVKSVTTGSDLDDIIETQMQLIDDDKKGISNILKEHILPAKRQELRNIKTLRLQGETFVQDLLNEIVKEMRMLVSNGEKLKSEKGFFQNFLNRLSDKEEMKSENVSELILALLLTKDFECKDAKAFEEFGEDLAKILLAKIVKIHEAATNEKKTLESNKNISELILKEKESELQEFKAFEAYGESLPQTIVQLNILVKTGFQNITNFGVYSSIIAGYLSLLITTSSLILSLPFYINGEKKVQMKSSTLKYAIVLPLSSLNVTPKIITLSLFFSLSSLLNVSSVVTCLLILVLSIVMYYIGYFILLMSQIQNSSDSVGTTVLQR